ncbi:radical SAM protein (plasmid) [Streptosporangium sp. NBC_01495]|uniref:B12-binding domain-containing radical SAM protein n=1 Tax=Streptosporangium sp. NBC_01495 TaxID=2903899 RepID=UPI002E35296A|nr:radical SAM protein [Streptosporangium sp. NBC_01495]
MGKPYDPAATTAPDPLRVVFFLPYGHEFSLLCMGALALYDLINRDSDIPAVAERAIVYACLGTAGNRLAVPGGQAYRSIENPAPVVGADVLGVSVTNSADLVSLFKVLDLAGIPRRSADRVVGVHPLVVGGNGGFANPEILADYLDVVAQGEAERSFVELIGVVYRGLRGGASRQQVWEQLAGVAGLYVPQLYTCDVEAGGAITAIRPSTPRAPRRVAPQVLAATELHRAHFVAPISDGRRVMMVPTLGCRHSCHFCTLGVPEFRQAPLKVLQDYLRLAQRHGIAQVVISSPTFTQYRHHGELLAQLRDYTLASGEAVSTIIGSVRADELTPGYLSAVAEVGDFGHLFTELQLPGRVRGIVTIAPEFASEDLVAIFNKTMTNQRVRKALELLRDNPDFAHVMLYFIVGAPGESRQDRLRIADYAAEVFSLLGRDDGSVIVKLQQFMPKPGTVSQRLEMADPALVDGYVQEIRERLADLVGAESYRDHFRVLWGESSRLYLESICLRGDRRVGPVLEELYDSGQDLTRLSGEQLREVLAAHGLEHERFLRRLDPHEVLPWEVVNTVDRAQEAKLTQALDARAAASS